MGIFSFLMGNDINKGVEEYKSTTGAYLIDVRTREEYREGHIPESKNIPLHEIGQIGNLVTNKDTPLFVHCLSGGRSGEAVSVLKRMGYTKVKNIGGISAYTGKVEKS
ncbi:MAG: rhodanese-like domain-containing protein [Clostridiales bacterium]|nr:rhodanese-like domain-containing protein [Clostridiales bacterium]MBP3940816.1 rhodanese-like domain-containing protein [Christensenellaceae bacterium]